MLTGEFKKSSKSTVIQDCVYVAQQGNDIVVKDSKTGATMTFTHSEWVAFIGGAKDGEFDIAG